jgi:hypothetical protein
MQDGGYTPETIFGMLLAFGFETEVELENALKEFACIEECNWARLMLQGFREQ